MLQTNHLLFVDRPDVFSSQAVARGGCFSIIAGIILFALFCLL